MILDDMLTNTILFETYNIIMNNTVFVQRFYWSYEINFQILSLSNIYHNYYLNIIYYKHIHYIINYDSIQ